MKWCWSMLIWFQGLWKRHRFAKSRFLKHQHIWIPNQYSSLIWMSVLRWDFFKWLNQKVSKNESGTSKFKIDRPAGFQLRQVCSYVLFFKIWPSILRKLSKDKIGFYSRENMWFSVQSWCVATDAKKFRQINLRVWLKQHGQ